MNIKILFDKKIPSRKFASGWGFSALIDDHVLFDTGCDGKRLLKNMDEMKIDFKKIEAVVISHNHWDHWGGLKELLKMRSGIQLWVGREGFEKSRFIKSLPAGNMICYPGASSVVSDHVYSTGEIEGRYMFKKMPEQSLILKTSRGLTIVTGCAHPGIVKILETVRERFKENIYLVLGGFHLFGKRRKTIDVIVRRFKELGVENVAPCHCSGKTALNMFHKAYGNNFMDLKVGDSFEV
ncbi:MAG: MBL fold metallo-hydrolase [Candidatus Omnitrophica bacterium]|nr:MBL fold metallo-hydrolase [Candidatus Omnitrophota bacterium]MDD5670705.1 MBL fold metallo-hydrolase [Candidatus Omnitrophota bacterium]